MRRHDLMRLHAAHKLELLARSPRAYRELGRLVADGIDAAEYRARLAAALAEPAARGRNANALRHAAGYLPAADRAEAAELIDRYERGEMGFAAARAAVAGAAERHGIEYLLAQSLLRG